MSTSHRAAPCKLSPDGVLYHHEYFQNSFPRQTAKLPDYCEDLSSSGSLPVTHGMSSLLAHGDLHIPADCRNLILFSQQGVGTTEQDTKLYCRIQVGSMKINSKYKWNAQCQAHSKWLAQNSQFNKYFWVVTTMILIFQNSIQEFVQSQEMAFGGKAVAGIGRGEGKGNWEDS